MTEAEIWKSIENYFIEKFDLEETPSIESILFLIGVRELGSGKQKYSKDDKINLIHIAVCRLLEPFGFYKFKEFGEDGWPIYDQLETLPELQPNEQSILMKKAVIQYFQDEELINYEADI